MSAYNLTMSLVGHVAPIYDLLASYDLYSKPFFPPFARFQHFRSAITKHASDVCSEQRDIIHIHIHIHISEPDTIRLVVQVGPTTLPTFDDGNPQEATEFLRRFKQWMISMTSTDSGMKAEYFASCFSAFSPAEHFYNALPKAVRTDYDTLVEDFRTEFIDYVGPTSPTKSFSRFCHSRLNDADVDRIDAHGRVSHIHFAEHIRSLLHDLEFVPEDVKCLILRRNCGHYTRQLITADVRQPVTAASIITYISELKAQDLREFIRIKEENKEATNVKDDGEEIDRAATAAATSFHLGQCLHGFSQLSMRSNV